MWGLQMLESFCRGSLGGKIALLEAGRLHIDGQSPGGERNQIVSDTPVLKLIVPLLFCDCI